MDRNPEEVAYEQVFYAVDEQLANLIHKIVKPENNLWNMDNQALIDRFFDVRNQVVDLIVAINQCDLHTEEVEGKNDYSIYLTSIRVDTLCNPRSHAW